MKCHGIFAVCQMHQQSVFGTCFQQHLAKKSIYMDLICQLEERYFRLACKVVENISQKRKNILFCKTLVNHAKRNSYQEEFKTI